jgi:hypothetical protein
MPWAGSLAAAGGFVAPSSPELGQHEALSTPPDPREETVP